MNKKSWWILVPVFMAACAKPTSLDYLGIKNIKVISLGFTESTVGVDVEYYNPNRYQLTMKRAEVDVYVNNNYFGKTTLDSTIHIPRRDTFYLPVVLKVDMQKTGMSVLQTLGKDEVMVKLEGTARIGRSGIFINYPIKYEGLQKVKL